MYSIDAGRVTYAASTSVLAIHARRSSGLVAAGVSVAANDRHPVRAVGRPDLVLLADPVADEGLAERGFVAHAPALWVGLRRPDYAVRLLALAVLLEANSAPHRDHAVALSRLDEDVVLHDRLELVDTRLHHSLLFLGRAVFEVLRQAADLPL